MGKALLLCALCVMLQDDLYLICYSLYVHIVTVLSIHRNVVTTRCTLQTSNSSYAIDLGASYCRELIQEYKFKTLSRG